MLSGRTCAAVTMSPRSTYPPPSESPPLSPSSLERSDRSRQSVRRDRPSVYATAPANATEPRRPLGKVPGHDGIVIGDRLGAMGAPSPSPEYKPLPSHDRAVLPPLLEGSLGNQFLLCASAIWPTSTANGMSRAPE